MPRRTLLLLPLLAVALVGPAAAQDGSRKCTLRWYGQSFFQLETSIGKHVVFDPHGIPLFGRHRVSADVTLISHQHNDHNQKDVLENAGRVFEGVVADPKTMRTEWKTFDEKVGMIRVRNLGTYHDAMNGLQRGKNSIWIVEVDGLVFVHLGDLGHELTADQFKAIGKVDVLMVPVGGIYTLNGDQAKRVVDQLKPRRYVLPMHYGVPGYDDILGPDEFLGEFDKKQVRKTPESNELVIPLDGKTAEHFTVVQLGWKKGEPLKK
jgi:L-ascorbate metabolism protein UlaG (beta-lactamase superfamily)